MALPEIESSVPKEGLNRRNAHHLAFLWVSNLLNPHKLAVNARHPIGEWLHTSHKQGPVEMVEGVEYHLVEHRLGSRLVTIDIIQPDEFARGLIPRARQLFDGDFYYGKDEYFPYPFRLVDRTYVKDNFDQGEHVRNVLNRRVRG